MHQDERFAAALEWLAVAGWQEAAQDVHCPTWRERERARARERKRGLARMATTEGSPRRRQTALVPVLWSAVMTFVAIAGVLALQLRSGHDPAFAKSSASARPPRRVIIHRVIRTRVVVVDAPADRVGDTRSGNSQTGTSVISAPAASSSLGASGPKQVASPAAPAVPAPSPVPSSAPAPVTKSS